MNDAKILSEAAKMACHNRQTKNFFLAAIALRKDGVFVSSVNITTAHSPSPSCHAEARVLRKSGYGSILWVSRVLKRDWTWALAFPCQSCRVLILNKGVSKVFYTTGPGMYDIWKPQND